MAEIDVILPTNSRYWQIVLAERLAAAGHDVRLLQSAADDAWPTLLEATLSVERRVASRFRPLWERANAAALPASHARAGRALRIDLTGRTPEKAETTVLSPAFEGSPSAAAAAITVAANRLPIVRVLRDGDVPVAEAKPMLDARLLVGRGFDDVLARTVSLLAAAVERHLRGALSALREDVCPGPARKPLPGLAKGLAFSTVPALARECIRRAGHWPSHWRVGYRFHEGMGLAETGSLAGPDWSILPDDGRRYYADPFPFEWQGSHYLFVEEYPHETGKGVISVARFDANRHPTTPQVVLEKPFHLSYPQVFELDGGIWMLPESGAGRELSLYKAECFPDQWVRHAVLIEGRELYDATLLRHGGRYWLFAAERDGAGSTSDMLVVFHSERLEGPWLPHKANPVLIDYAAARPAGAFVHVGRRLVRPVQDGTLGYGGGLCLSDVIRLDEERVELSQPVPLLLTRNWPYPRIHTLNRAGSLEVIDGIANVRKRDAGPASREAA